MRDSTNRPFVRRRAWGVGLAVALLLGAVAACGTSSSSSPRPSAARPTSSAGSQPASSTAPATPAQAAAQLATATYVKMWQAMAQADQTANWQAPYLANYATGNALTTITRSLYADFYNHLVSRGAPVDHPSVSSVDPSNDPTTVRITDCGDSTKWLQYKEGTNQLAPNSPVGRRSIFAEVTKQPDGSWKVDQFAVEALGSC